MSNIKVLKNLPYIRKENLSLIFPDIKESSFSQNIKNWIKSGKIIKLKRGFYISAQYYENCKDKEGYLGYLASLLCFPSYLSRETVLNQYGILTESVFGISSVTNKTTKSFSSRLGSFNYSKIKEPLFTGFKEKIFMDKKYFGASKSKALFDYLYFTKRTLKTVNKRIVGELRLNMEMLDKKDWLELKTYIDMSNSEKMRRIYKILEKPDAN